MDSNRVLKGAASAFGLAAGLKYIDDQYQIVNDVKFLGNLVSVAGPLEKSPMDRTVGDVWDETVAQFVNKPAVVFAEDGRSMTFGEVDAMARKVAVWARETAGFKSGEVVALFMQNRPEFFWYLMGLAKAGLVTSLINTSNKQKPLLHSLDVANCKAIIYGAELEEAIVDVQTELQERNLPVFSMDDGATKASAGLGERMEDVLAATNGDAAKQAKTKYRSQCKRTDAFGYIYTSGTTGLPKACVVTNLKFMTMASTGRLAHYSPEDVVYSVLPMYHSAGLGLGFGNTVINGGTIVLARKFSASRFFKDCTTYGATAVQYIGELCRYLVVSPPTEWDRKHKVRIAMGNGLRKEVWSTFQERFNIPEIFEFYGATEGNVSFLNHFTPKSNPNRAGSVGLMGAIARKIAGFRIVQHDIDTETARRDPQTGLCIECAPGETGELLGFINPARAATAFSGYTSKEATEKKILRDVFVKGDAYFRSGDLMKREADGRIFFVDRIGDTFRWKGENVSTGEVAEVVSVFPGVMEANVYGVQIPGLEDGRACMAALSLTDGFDIDAFASHVQRNLATYAMPLFLRYLPEGAMDSTGTFKHRKVDYVKEGCDPTTISDPLFYFDSQTKTYKPLDAPAMLRISTGQAKL